MYSYGDRKTVATALKRELWGVLGNYPGRLEPEDYQHVFAELAEKAKDTSQFAPLYVP